MLRLSSLQADDEFLEEEPQILNVAADQEDEKPHKAKATAVRSGRETSVSGTMGRNAQPVN